jgi:DNA helicase-2/ATP-dependent DNA helicase PcrA
MDYSTKFQERYDKLNLEQREAVDSIEGPVLIIAGPGSGKTEILSMSVANKLLKTDALASAILCLTFTDAAAANMRKRLASLIGAEAYKVAIHTFHSFGSEIINQNPQYFFKGASVTVADELVQIQIIEKILTSFDHTSLLSSYHPVQGYTYLSDILKRIGELKQGGITPNQFKEIIEENAKFLDAASPLLSEVFNDRISMKILAKSENLYQELKNLDTTGKQSHMLEELNIANEEAKSTDKTKTITEWKNKYSTKDKEKNTVFKDAASIDKQRELAKIYELYQDQLHSNGYFDYNDMILEVIKQTNENPDLRYNIQERYQYVLVDEFQDTSGAQMQLLDAVLDAEANEGQPNVLVVGDDDQSIFKFQGAKIANIMGFHKKYRDPKIIVLTKNYRSTQDILDLARNLICQSQERLENTLPGVIKLLTAETKQDGGKISEHDFPSELHEYTWIAQEIKKLVEQGQNIEEIAIIAPKHRILKEIAKVLDYFEIPLSYEQKKDILKEKHIHEILQIAKFINSISSQSEIENDEYLSEILAFDFLEVEKIDIWKISLQANRERKTWLEVMLEFPNEKIQQLAKFFIELGALKIQLTAEEVLDIIIGSSCLDDLPTSPYKEFYFSSKKDGYIELLSELESFFSTIRNYQSKEGISLGKFLEFIELNEKHNIKIKQNINRTNEVPALNLMTAHKAKGQEFECVFVVSCQDEIWIKRSNSSNVQLPSNLPLSPDSENVDDQLRLFYVAITRAKRKIYLSYHLYADSGKEQSKLRFLEEESSEKSGGVMPQKISAIKQQFAEENNLVKLIELGHQISKHRVSTPSDRLLLQERVKDYKLSVTHLNNFLNVSDGGPQKFLEQNLLRFPQKQNTASAYGTAVHDALNALQKKFKTNAKPELAFFIHSFNESLDRLRMNQTDTKFLREKGHDQLATYYKERIDSFNPKDFAEYNFDLQSVLIGQAHITGKIDKMHISESEIEVVDYKTGKPLKRWDGYQDYEKIKSWKYRNQLCFYKLLVENSRDFRGKQTVNFGALEFIEAKDEKERILKLNLSQEDSLKMAQIIEKVYEKIQKLDFPDTSHYEQSIYGILSFCEDLLADRI